MTINFGLEGFVGPTLYAAAVVAFVVSFFRPAVALYVVVPLLPFNTVRYRLHEYPLGHSFIDLMLFASCAGSLIAGGLKCPKPLLRLVLVVTVVFTYLSLWKGAFYLSLPTPLWFDDLRLANWKNNVVVPLVLFVAVYSAIRTRRQMLLLFGLMCLTTTLFNRNIYNTIGQADHSSFSYQSRAEDGQIGANGFAAYEVQFAFMLFGVAAFEARRSVKGLYWAVAMFCLYCVMLTYSRGAYAAFLLGWIVLGFVAKRKLLVGLAIFLATWQSIVPNAVRERVFMTITDDGSLESSAATRITLWEDARDVASVDPVFGIGYDTYEFMHRVGPYTDTHNFYMKVLVETGIVGLAILLTLFYQLARLGFTTFRRAEDPFFRGLGLGLFLWMACALVTNIFGDRWNYIQITGYLWTAAAILMRGRQMEGIDSPDDPEVVEELAEPALVTA